VWCFKGRTLFLQSRLKGYSPESTDLFLFLAQFAITYGGRGLVVFLATVLGDFLATVGPLFLHSFGEEVDGEKIG
jgi:hypothetical protein